MLKNPTTILAFDDIRTEGDQKWLYFTINQDNFIEGGIAQYQLFEDNNLKEYGSCQIIPSLLVNEQQELRGKYQVIVEAIEKQLAGVATTAQRHVQVGDKSIDKYTANDLLKLLDYFKGKLAEEEAENNINPKTDQMTIKYVWRIR